MVKRKGFTLLELLIVVGLIGILVAIGTASYSTIQKKARDSQRMEELKAIQNALEQYYAVHSSYPIAAYTDAELAPYFPGGAPTDPKTACYYRQTALTATTYTICADLEGDGSFLCTTPCGDGTAGAGCLDVTDFCVNNLQ